jgi:hypothetical protein
MSFLDIYNKAIEEAVGQQALLEGDEVTLSYDDGFKETSTNGFILSEALEMAGKIVEQANEVANEAKSDDLEVLLNMAFSASVRGQVDYAEGNSLAKPLIHAAIDVAAETFETITGHKPKLDFVNR